MDRTHLVLTSLVKHHTTLSSLSGIDSLGTMFGANGIKVPKVFKDVALNKAENTSHKELARQVKVREALGYFEQGLKSFRQIVKAAGGELPREHWTQRISLGFSKHTNEPFLAIDIDAVRPICANGIPKIVAIIDAHQKLNIKGPFNIYDLGDAERPIAPYTLAADSPENAYRRLRALLSNRPDEWHRLVIRQHIDGAAVKATVDNDA